MSPLPWIKLDTGLVSHPKLADLCAEVSDPRSLDYLVRLWCWCAHYAADGVVRARDASHLTRTVETVAGWSGDAGRLFAALRLTGWLDEASDGSVRVHDWDEYQGPHAERLERDRDRMREKRKSGQYPVNSRATVARPSGERRGGEERRVEEKDQVPVEATKPPAQFPATVASPPAPQGGDHGKGQGQGQDKPTCQDKAMRPWLAEARSVLHLEENEAPSSRPLAARYAAAARQYGPDHLLDSLAGLRGHRDLPGLLALLSDGWIQRGLAAARDPGEKPKPDPESRPHPPPVEEVVTLPPRLDPSEAKRRLAELREHMRMNP